MFDMIEDVKRKGIISEIVRRLDGIEKNLRKVVGIGGTALSTVATDGSLTGDGTVGSPLSVAVGVITVSAATVTT